LDGDGDLDAFVAIFWLMGGGAPNRVWLNDGLGLFHDSGQSLGDSGSMGVALGDMDSDGDLDAFVANQGPSWNDWPDVVWRNDGIGSFRASGQRLGDLHGLGVAWGDLNGDGALDAFVANFIGSGWEGETDTVWLNIPYRLYVPLVLRSAPGPLPHLSR
jgi:hypothetical protein